MYSFIATRAQHTVVIVGSILDVEDMIFLLYDMNSWLWAPLSKESHLSQN